MEKYIYILLIITLLYLIYKSFNNCDHNEEHFTPFNVLTDYKDIKELNKLAKKLVSIFHKNKFIYWTSGGTTLGAIRDKGIIPWDDDVDFCIMDTDINNLFNMEKELKNKELGIVEWFGGYKVYDLNGKDIPNKNFKYPFIDLFVYTTGSNDTLVLKGSFARDFWPNEYYYKNEVYPLKLYDFEDYQLYGPNNANSYLDRNFPDWKIKALKTYDHVKHEKFKKTEFPIEYNKDAKPYLWQYWDGPKSSFINLSMKTVELKCSKSFNIIKLNKDNIYNYLPEMKEYEEKIKDMLIAQKVDIYRIMLLYKYGGIYLDADTVVLRDPIEIIKKLKKYDFVGFGCTSMPCKNGYGQPSNWILAARPHSILMAHILKNQLEQIHNKTKFDYHDLGKLVIWKELNNLINNQNYEYYHYDSKIDGSRDKYGNWINSDIVFSNEPIEYDDEDNMIFFVYYNSNIDKNIKTISEKDLMNKNWNITKFLKKGLDTN